MIKKLYLGAVTAAALLLGCSVVEVGGLSNPYFPLAEGSTWVYETSGSVRVDTLVCIMTEKEPGVYSWISYIRKDPGSVSMLAADIGEGSEPFNDSTRIRLDSLLSWDGARITIPMLPDIVDFGHETVKTPAGLFNECLLVHGESDSNGNRFDVWMARDVGPVQIYHWSGNQVIRIFRLLSYQPAD